MLKNTIAWLATVGLFLTAPAMAAQVKSKAEKPKEMTFEGAIVSVDVPDRTFTVRNEVKGNVSEMRFHVGRESNVLIDGQRMLLSELEKGEHVTVTYEPAVQPMAKAVHRHGKTSPSR